VLDLSFGNLLITKEGHLLLIDTNQLFDAWEYQKSNDGQIQKVPSSPQMNMRNQIDLLKEFIEYCNGRLKTDLPSNHPSSPQSK
ncbi:hypothetical protein KJ632_01135, partial [Patescibacteria group bacterium]|nr:hypothetical protein [Patescibacteria group bacterium]